MATPVLSLERIDVLRGSGGPGLIRKLARIFGDTIPARIEAASAELERGDLDAFRRSAHALRSSAGSIGAERMQLAAAAIEDAPGDVALDALATMWRELEDAFVATTAALRELPDLGPEDRHAS